MSWRLDLVRRALDAFNDDNFEEFASVFAEESEIVPYRGVLEATVYRGPDAPRQFWESRRDVWEETRIELRELEEVGDQVLMIGLLRGRGRESGASGEILTGWTASFADGAVSAMRTYGSADEARAALS